VLGKSIKFTEPVVVQPESLVFNTKELLTLIPAASPKAI
jgi:hypothetical protein